MKKFAVDIPYWHTYTVEAESKEDAIDLAFAADVDGDEPDLVWRTEAEDGVVVEELEE